MFSRENMRFAGDTVRNFGARRIAGKHYLYRKGPTPKMTGNSWANIWEFTPSTDGHCFRSCRDSSIWMAVYGVDITIKEGPR